MAKGSHLRKVEPKRAATERPKSHEDPPRRLSFKVPQSLYDELQEFADERGDTMTGVFRWCLGTGKLVWDEIQDQQRIVTIDESGNVTKQFVFQR
jgi:hypothetical protein